MTPIKCTSLNCPMIYAWYQGKRKTNSHVRAKRLESRSKQIDDAANVGAAGQAPDV